MKLRKTQGAGIALTTALLLGAGFAGAAQDKGTPMPGPDYVKYDHNADGAISLDEYVAHEKTAQAFKDADADKNGHLDADEFIKARAIDDRVKLGEIIDDAWITTKVKAMLLKDSGLAGLKVEVDTKDGVVTLSGQAESGKQIDQAVRIASAIKGVKEVHNALGTPGTTLPDFKQADADRDGYLSSKEGMGYVGTSLSLDEKTFKAADTNGDGRLSQDEFNRHLESTPAKPMGESPTRPR